MRNYKLTGCFVDEEKKFSLIHIYKNASISMRNTLNMRGRYFEWDEIKNENTIKLCVIRDPINRIISIYQYLLRLEDNGFINKHPVHITKETDFYKNKNDIEKSFTQFIHFIEENGFYDAVTLPQNEFLSDRGLTIKDIDEIFIQEKMYECFNNFKNKYSIKKNISIDNTSDIKTTLFLKKYLKKQPKIKLIVENIYKDDFIMYNNLI